MSAGVKSVVKDINAENLILDFVRDNPEKSWAAFEIRDHVQVLKDNLSVTEVHLLCIALQEKELLTQQGKSEVLRRWK